MAMPQCSYLAKGAKRPSHTSNTIKFDRIPFDPCNSIKTFDLCPLDQKNSTYLQPPIAIYNPQTLKFQVALPTLSNCLHEYYKTFTSFREKRGTIIPYVIYVVGDFNPSKINWVNLSSSQSIDMEFLDLVADLGLNQFITVPTRIKGNTLDILFSTCDELCYSVYNN